MTQVFIDIEELPDGIDVKVGWGHEKASTEREKILARNAAEKIKNMIAQQQGAEVVK